MNTNSYENLLIIQVTIDDNRQQNDEKQMNTDEKLTQIAENLKYFTSFTMDLTDSWKFLPTQKDISTPL